MTKEICRIGSGEVDGIKGGSVPVTQSGCGGDGRNQVKTDLILIYTVFVYGLVQSNT